MDLKNNIIHFFYQQYKKILFRRDAEKVHDKMTALGEWLGESFLKYFLGWVLDYENEMLEQNILGIDFRNPLGLSAGFDYEARLTQILPFVGFGFHTVGSMTFGFYEGNKPPRLGRLPKSKSLLVNKGLKSSGTKNVLEGLKGKRFRIPLGISIAKTNSPDNCDDRRAIEDYRKSFEIVEEFGIGDYYEINISCPNAFGGEAFTTPDRLKKLLKEIRVKFTKPVFLKMPVDSSKEEMLKLCDVAKDFDFVSGVIIGNLTKDRNNPVFDKEEIDKAGKGNFSGLPTQKKSDELIKAVYKKFGKRFVIIGCGGVFSAEDAYRKIRNGASLVQMITGMIFEGPQVIGQINKGLVRLLKRDGFEKLSDAIGIDA